MSDVQRRVDEIRYRSSEMENHLIDTYRKGGIDRREFVRRSTVIGMSMGTVSFLASACGSGDKGDGAESTPAPTDAKVKPGGTVRAAINTPAGAVDPITVADDGGLAGLGQAGGYLRWAHNEPEAGTRPGGSTRPQGDA